jgi:hypothetical protein
MAGLVCNVGSKELTCAILSTSDIGIAGAGAGAGDDEEAGDAISFGCGDASSCCWLPPPSGLGGSAGAMRWWLFFCYRGDERWTGD